VVEFLSVTPYEVLASAPCDTDKESNYYILGKKIWAVLSVYSRITSTFIVTFFFRLMAEKINKNERKNKAEIITEMPGDESSDFWKVLGDQDGMPPDDPIVVLIPHT
jgi:hypothetical protein